MRLIRRVISRIGELEGGGLDNRLDSRLNDSRRKQYPF